MTLRSKPDTVSAFVVLVVVVAVTIVGVVIVVTGHVREGGKKGG